MATAFIRTIVLYLLIMVGLRLLGKRQIGNFRKLGGEDIKKIYREARG